MAKKSILEFIRTLGDLPGAGATAPAGEPDAMGGAASPAGEATADNPVAGGQHLEGVNTVRLARVFANDQVEENRIAVAFRRLMNGEHLTMEIKDLLLRQLAKVLGAAQSDRVALIHLEHMVHPERVQHPDMPERAGGTAATPLRFESVEVAEGIGSAVAATASFGGRVLRKILPKSGMILRVASEELKASEKLSPKARVLITVLVELLEVLERNPELLAMIREKTGGAKPEAGPAKPEADGPEPAVV